MLLAVVFRNCFSGVGAFEEAAAQVFEQGVVQSLEVAGGYCVGQQWECFERMGEIRPEVGQEQGHLGPL